MGFLNRNITDIHSFTTDEINYILKKAQEIKKALKNKDIDSYSLGRGRDLLAASLFYENSTRTRTSFEVAAMRLGMRVTGFTGIEGTSVKKGESLRHTLDMYEAYQVDTVIMRHPLDGAARFAADHLGVPVFNAGDGKHEHPTQTLLDLFTIKEHLGRINNLDVGIAGDLKYGRTVHSLAIALSKFEDIHLHLFSHESLALSDDFIDLVEEQGVKVTIYDDLAEMASKVDILYQTRIQKERMPDLSEYDKAKEMSRVTMRILNITQDHTGLMHPLPIDKTAPSIDASIDGHPKALYKRQAGNGVPTRLTELALSLGLMGDDFEGEVWQESSGDDVFYEERPSKSKTVRTDVSIRPIRNTGVVVDHMNAYSEDDLVRMLKVRERRDIYRAATVRSLKRPNEVKGMLMIEDRELTAEELKSIAAVSPGCTVNYVSNGEVVKKLKLRLPSRMMNIPGMSCSNKGCITCEDHQESVAPIMVRTGKQKVRCYYCDNVMGSVCIK